jgi:hypothetical protein
MQRLRLKAVAKHRILKRPHRVTGSPTKQATIPLRGRPRRPAVFTRNHCSDQEQLFDGR